MNSRKPQSFRTVVGMILRGAYLQNTIFASYAMYVKTSILINLQLKIKKYRISLRDDREPVVLTFWSSNKIAGLIFYFM